MSWLYVIRSVRCLACDTIYAKPNAVGTAESNPGCPVCGYVGWVPVDDEEPEEPTERAVQLHSGVDLHPHRFWQAS